MNDVFSHVDLDQLDKEVQQELDQAQEVDTNVEPEDHQDESVQDEKDMDTQVEAEVVESEEANEQESEQQTMNEEEDEDEVAKRNRAFAELRRRAERNEKYAEAIRRIAERAGVDPDTIVERIRQKELEQEAQEKKVPVEILQRLKALEEENQRIREQTIAQQMQLQIEEVQKKFNATDQDIRDTFAYMLKAGIDPREVPVDFEAFFKAAHFDRLLEQERKKAEQEFFSKKKERQEKAAASTHDGSAALSDDDIEAQIDKEVAAIVENWF
mgnify:FL=1